MSQDLSINQPVLSPSKEAAEPASWSNESGIPVVEPGTPIDSHADNLMDELFEEVNHILDKGVRVPPANVNSEEYVSLQSISVPEMGLSSVLVPHRQSDADQLDQLEADLEADLDVLSSAVRSEPRYGGKSLDRLLLISACASLVLTAILGLMLQGKWQRVEPSQNLATTDSLQAQSDAEFLDYMERSLEVIDRKATVTNPVATAGMSIPPGTASSTTGGAQPAQAPVAERVYVPVYQPPQSLSFPGLGQPAQPAQPVQPTQTQAVPPIQPAVPSAPAAAPAAIATAPNVAPSLNYTLRGLLELGDRSAALFEINGTPQRVYVGESIGGGWTLVSVQNQEALIRRNGEVRSIYVGQQF